MTDKSGLTLAPTFEDRCGDIDGATPDFMLIEFDPGVGHQCIRAVDLSLDVFDPLFEGSPRVAVIALRAKSGVALHIGHSADDLRAFAAHALRSADQIDAGRGKQ